MGGLDLQMFSKSTTSSVLTSLDVLGDSQKDVKDYADPMLVLAALLGTADSQYGQVSGDSFGTGQFIISKPENVAWMRPPYMLSKLIRKETLDVKGLQDSGGAALVTAMLLIAYKGKGKSMPYKPGVLVSERVSCTDAAAAFGTKVKTTVCKTNKQYQLLGYYPVGTDSLAVRFSHGDFDGLRPGGPSNGTDVLENHQFFFPEIPGIGLPTFSGSEQLGVETAGVGTNGCVIELLLNEI